MQNERLQKILSQAGLGSRREIETWITQGLVSVNGITAVLGTKANAQDKISVNGRLISNPLKKATFPRVLLYHKPIGEICSRQDAHHSKTVFSQLPKLSQGRWVQVGRLDINTSGLLLFTNDGDLANQLMHPRFGLEREYAVRVHGQVLPTTINTLLKGVMLEDGKASFKKITYQGGEGTNSWYHVVLTEGRNREVRRLWESQGLEVSRLIRIRYGCISMPRFLGRGESYELPKKEVENLIGSIKVK